MHEPFASLDDQTRLLLSDKMLQIQHELSQTALFITHNITEAVQPSDRILVMARRRNQSARPGTSKISSFTAFGRYVAEIWSDHREEAARSTQESEMGARDGKRLIMVVGQCTRGSWRAVSFGFVWSNEVGQRCLGAPFGGATQSSTRRGDCSEKILLFTAEKNIHIKLRAQRQ
jgi:ABC-type proline/glycine betaine transport system ATPase subunit